MSMYTPGPWECDLQGYGAFAIEADSRQGGYIVIADRGPHRTRAEEMHANARLISAAPDLLEMVDRLTRSFPTDSDMHAAGWEQHQIDEACNAFDAARALVKKITGPE